MTELLLIYVHQQLKGHSKNYLSYYCEANEWNGDPWGLFLEICIINYYTNLT
jgi:hypothetical protein